MKYLIELDRNAHQPETFAFADSGEARAVFADCRDLPGVFAGSLVAVSETGARMTLERITH